MDRALESLAQREQRSAQAQTNKREREDERKGLAAAAASAARERDEQQQKKQRRGRPSLGAQIARTRPRTPLSTLVSASVAAGVESNSNNDSIHGRRGGAGAGGAGDAAAGGDEHGGGGHNGAAGSSERNFYPLLQGSKLFFAAGSQTAGATPAILPTPNAVAGAVGGRREPKSYNNKGDFLLLVQRAAASSGSSSGARGRLLYAFVRLIAVFGTDPRAQHNDDNDLANLIVIEVNFLSGWAAALYLYFCCVGVLRCFRFCSERNKTG